MKTNEFQSVSEIPDIPTSDEINAGIQNMNDQFDENVLQNLTDTITKCRLRNQSNGPTGN